MDGFLVINKEKNMTSHDVCNKVRRKFNFNKTGHTGTLDPSTTGVLVVGVNNATKLMSFLAEHTKEYNATIMFGRSSETLDLDGLEIEEDNDFNLDYKDLEKVINSLKEQKTQIPPMYSSIKVNGKKLYEYARKKQEVKVEARDVTIYDLKLTSDIYIVDGFRCVDCYMKTSKGFYVRSLVRDIGQMLNIKTLMSKLDRVSSGDFKIDNAKTISEVDTCDILSIEDVFSDFSKLEVNDYMAKLVSNGVLLDERQIVTSKPLLVYNNKKLIAVYEPFKDGQYKLVVKLI